MDRSSILVVHDGKQPPTAVEKSLASGGWRVVAMPTRRQDWRGEGQGIDCAVVVLEGEDAAGAPKIVERLRAADDNLPVVVVARA